MDLKSKIREVPDFPTPGVSFKDIMPLLADADALHAAVDRMAEWAEPRMPEIVLGGEARGFFLGAALAYRLGCGFVPARRPGKLPLETIRREYELEYGSNILEVQAGALGDHTRVLVHDDVLATGGTAHALAELVEHLEGEVVGFTFLIELTFLNGRARIPGYDVFAVVDY